MHPLVTQPITQLRVSHTGDIYTSPLSLSNVILVPKLSLLISIGQLHELDFDIHFSSYGCIMQDRQMRQIIRTGRRVGHLFQLVSLNIPHSFNANAATVSSATWHSHLAKHIKAWKGARASHLSKARKRLGRHIANWSGNNDRLKPNLLKTFKRNVQFNLSKALLIFKPNCSKRQWHFFFGLSKFLNQLVNYQIIRITLPDTTPP